MDLVGHDWGCILTLRVASCAPDLVRTWAGGNGPVDSAYVWHPLAKIWQDQVEGDRFHARTASRAVRPGTWRPADVPIRLAKRWRAAWTSR